MGITKIYKKIVGFSESLKKVVGSLIHIANFFIGLQQLTPPKIHVLEISKTKNFGGYCIKYSTIYIIHWNLAFDQKNRCVC